MTTVSAISVLDFNGEREARMPNDKNNVNVLGVCKVLSRTVLNR